MIPTHYPLFIYTLSMLYYHSSTCTWNESQCFMCNIQAWPRIQVILISLLFCVRFRNTLLWQFPLWGSCEISERAHTMLNTQYCLSDILHTYHTLCFVKFCCGYLLWHWDKCVWMPNWHWSDPENVINVSHEFINTLGQRQNGCHFPEVIFKLIFMNETVCISTQIPLKSVTKGPIDSKSALVIF